MEGDKINDGLSININVNTKLKKYNEGKDPKVDEPDEIQIKKYIVKGSEAYELINQIRNSPLFKASNDTIIINPDLEITETHYLSAIDALAVETNEELSFIKLNGNDTLIFALAESGKINLSSINKLLLKINYPNWKHKPEIKKDWQSTEDGAETNWN